MAYCQKLYAIRFNALKTHGIMAQESAHDVETIVNALLQVSDRVAEISKDHIVTRIWDGYSCTLGESDQYLGKKIVEISNESIIKECDDLVTTSFTLRTNSHIQYHLPGEHSVTTYSIRILAIHPDADYLFVVIKNLSVNEGIEIVEDKWRLALDAAGDGVWDLNIQTGKIFFSAKWHDIFGYDATEISSWDDWSDKIHPDDRKKYRHTIEEYFDGKKSSYFIEQRFLCRDGTYKWILSRGVVISKTSDGKPLRAIGTHHDINERKIAEETLKTSRETFASAFDHSGIGIALLGSDGRWLDVNNVICDMSGYTREELLQLTHLDVTHPDDTHIDSGLIEQLLSKDIFKYTIEKRYLSKQKKIVSGLLTVSLVWNGDNTPKFFITQVIDITKKKELENEIKRKNSELEMAKVNLTNKINKLEKLNNIIVNNLMEPADNIKALSKALLIHKKEDRPASLNVLNSTLTHDEALELLRESSSSLINSLAELLASSDHSKG